MMQSTPAPVSSVAEGAGYSKAAREPAREPATETATEPAREVSPGTDSAWAGIRVLHGLSGAAGQPWMISRAQRRLGLVADSVCLGVPDFGYQADHYFESRTPSFPSVAQFLEQAGRRYDVFHYYFRPFFYPQSRRLICPAGLDLLALRAAGKVVVFHYRGSEVRTAERFRELSPFHYVDENPHGLFHKFPTATVNAFRDFVQGVANLVLVPDPELRSYVPEAQIVPRAIDLEEWGCVGVPDDESPLVVHAPSRRTVKGTDAVLQAVSDLRSEGLSFRFQLVSNMSNEQAREVYRQASIIVDQLRIGWYGVLAVEGMALGKAVIAYIRDDLKQHLESDPPLACADPHTVKTALRELITDAARRKRLGRRAREYCEAVHDSRLVARQLAEMYRAQLENPRPVRLDACFRFFETQAAHTLRAGASKPARWRDWFARYRELIRESGLWGGTGIAMNRLARRALARPRPIAAGLSAGTREGLE